MKSSGLARIGKDLEVRYLPNGDAVGNLSLAFTRRVKGENVTDWVEAAMFGKRAESLAPYLKKGGQVVAHLSDLHIEIYDKKDGGQGFKLSARIDDLELVSSQASQAPSAPRQAPQQARQSGGYGFDDMQGSDVPFRDPLAYKGVHLAI